MYVLKSHSPPPFQSTGPEYFASLGQSCTYFSQTHTQLLLLSLGERERRLDSTEARRVTWEGAKEI